MDTSIRCRTKKLFYAMNIEPTEHKIKLIKLDFFLRLDSDGLTNELIKYTDDIDIKDNKVREIFEITEILEFDTCVTIQKHDVIRCEREEEQTRELRRIFDTKDRSTISMKIFES
ncbi:hypothetical protein BpHYR1_027934 [Brachionus plicatilis]|uniref:RNA-directed DNA polymerase from mobile element jockey-like n=1 Tax=Brachionus plicatilis TaxID=10195 RepID=A0A3M7PK92_BRAPC|nr:hypothetical protein BpHYR1_027934 [Brachionus plicatilis]